jgi:hypothetical protein
MSNLTFTFKQGEVGKVITFDDLSDANGLVDLTPYAVTMNLRLNGELIVDDAAVTKRTQSGTTLGDCYHTLNSTTAAIAVGTYRGELKLVNGANIFYWPVNKNADRTYFTVIVQAPLA